MSALIWCPFPDRAAAAEVAAALLDEKLIACANMIDAMHSMFEWGGTRDAGSECGVLFKTHGSLLKQAVARIEALHPYDAPAVLGWHCEVPGQAAEDWLSALTHGGGRT